jgi:hypothetical protein
MRSAVLASISALLLAACGPSSTGGGGDDDDEGAADADPSGGDPDARSGPNEFADAAPEPTCGEQEEDIEVVNNGEPPDLLIVLDRSGSMTSPIDLFDPFGGTRWSVMVDALETITATHDANIRFGLAVFPTDNNCGVAPGTEVAIGDSTSGMIASYLGTTSADGNTPAHFALQNALDVYASIPVNPNGRYVLYATDGEPNCDEGSSIGADAEVVDAVEALYGEDIKTFVLGFGPVFGLDVTNLNDAALAGGVPKAGGPPHYYHAENAADLEAALEDIAGGIIVPSCEYELTQLPPDPDDVTVTMDGVPVPRSLSHTDGWDYHPDEWHITFFGSYCDQLIGGSVASVAFTYGCPGPVID